MRKVLFLLLVAFSFVYVGSAIECMDCHNLDMPVSPPIYPAINVSLFGFHKDVNTTDGGLSSSDCTGCHYGANTSIFFHGPAPVLTFTCEDCHLRGSAPRVYNHLKNTNISVSIACYDCHNKTSVFFKYSASASAAHYGRNASFGLPPGKTYCGYCHQNSSTIYRDVMQNPNNIRIGNHTSDITSIYPLHPAGPLPNCTSCHGQDKLHGKNITKPVPNSGFCNSCHLNDRIQKNRHSGRVECIRCHTETPSDIHNIKYILPGGSYRSVNATGCGSCHDSSLNFRLTFSTADCTTCHQGNGLKKFPDAPIIPTPMNHSTNPFSGALWNGSQPEYWSNTSTISSCNYCHGHTPHSLNAFGKVENIRSGNMPNQTITNTGYWCANCHYKNGATGNYSYNASAFYPVPPEIQNKTGLVPEKANDDTSFFNHSLNEWSDKTCLQCHGAFIQVTSALFVHNVASGGGGANCTLCHDVKGTGAPVNKRINISAFNKSVHRNLNKGGNSACWACHGNGTEPSRHPPEYKSPRRCENDNCHSLNQNYRAPMVYSHFKNASLNSNPNNALNFNVTTKRDCEDCHVNSVIAQANNKNSTVSHYAFLDELPASINCIYCHLDKDNSEKWGNATEINKNRTSTIELNRDKNKFIARAGEFTELGLGYSIKVLEISIKRGSAIIELYKGNELVDSALVNTGNYTFEENRTINNATSRFPVIVLNITSMFLKDNESFIQFEGFRARRVHLENRTTACYFCHFNGDAQKHKYTVIDRRNDYVYYAEVLFNSSDKNEYDQEQALGILAYKTPEDAHTDIERPKRKTLQEREKWELAENFSLTLEDVAIQSDSAKFLLEVDGNTFTDMVSSGNTLNYELGINYLGYQYRNITLFRAKVSEIMQGNPNIVVLEDIFAMSPEIKKVDDNTSFSGYNTSWLWENDTFLTGRIPASLHAPQLFDGRDGGPDCSSCHSIELGLHAILNQNASSSVPSPNKPCWACHGEGKEPKWHPATYKSPRMCRSCHAERGMTYNATYVGDEKHGSLEGCSNCHAINIHKIIKFDVVPGVSSLSLSRGEVYAGEKVRLNATAVGGYNMRVRGAEYYIDSPASTFPMFPIDGSFDEQIEEITAEIDTSGLKPGTHSVYVRAMERNNKWGQESAITFEVKEKEVLATGQTKTVFKTVLLFVLVLLAMVEFILIRRRVKANQTHVNLSDE